MKMKKLSILPLTLFVTACSLDLDVVIPEQTTSSTTESMTNSTTSEPTSTSMD